MNHLATAVLAASTFRTIGYVVGVLVAIGFVVYSLIDMRRGRPEVGAEIELAPNRKPYYSDEELEGRKLDLTLTLGLFLLAGVSISVPLYWLAEPGRQDGRKEYDHMVYVHRGEKVYNERAKCNSCHGPEGAGGVAKFTITDDEGAFVDQVEWKAPALNTVLMRYSKEEVFDILMYGRPGTPMPAWGVKGGGPLTVNDLNDAIYYLESIQLSPEEVRAQVDEGLIAKYLDLQLERETSRRLDAQLEPLGDDEKEALTEEWTTEVTARVAPDEGPQTFDYDLDGAWTRRELGQALFNLDSVASGAYACARCHTKNWSHTSNLDEPPAATADGVDAGGGYGPALAGHIADKYTVGQHIEFVTTGGDVLHGNWRMPGFGYNPNSEVEGALLAPEQFMFTAEQIAAIVEYERSL